MNLPSELWALMPPSGQPGQSAPPMWTQFVPFVLLFVMMYFLLIRPQQTKAKQLADMMKTLKKGDRILTSGGIIGVVVGVSDHSVTIRSAESKLEIQKSSLAEVLERASGSDT